MSKPTFTLDYDIGDEVWTIEFFSYTREVGCLRCNETGKITALEGDILDCGICKGRGSIFINKPYKGRPVKSKISNYSIETDSGLPKIKYAVKGNGFSHYPTLLSADIFVSFKNARNKARELNTKYGWPKENFQRDPYLQRHAMYWGYRVKKK